MTGGSLIPDVGDRLLDRYRVMARYSGGMGMLWTVRDLDTGQPYAVKSIKPGHRGDEELLRRFRAEAETWIALESHEHLVQALWLLEEARGLFLFLEYVDGRDLADVQHGAPLPLGRAVDLAMQCAAGMAYAHAKPIEGGVGVVHRDLKPTNLLVDHEGVLKVTDFGLARVFRPLDEGEIGVGVGTPAYMAPEQLRGERWADGRADIYSFGLVCYEMLTGSNPLAAGDFREQIDRVLHLVPAPLDEAPPAFAALVARCVAKDPAERPHDFIEVLGHLAQVARGLDGSFRVDPAGVPAPSTPTGLAVQVPSVRPRRPRAGGLLTIEVVARGDVGPGPVDIRWQPAMPEGLRVLNPEGEACAHVPTGGALEVRLRLHVAATQAGHHVLPAGALQVHGPAGATTCAVPPVDLDVVFAFVLPLTGRAAVVERLRACVEGVRRGEGGGLFLLGDVGSGKTRLLRECEALAARAGLRVVVSRAQDTGLRPMHMLSDAARKLLDLPLGVTGGVAAAVQALLADDPPTAHYFARVLAGEAALEAEVPLGQRWFALLQAASARGPLALLLDDVHLTDETSLRVVPELTAWVREAGLPVLIVATATVTESMQGTGTRRAVLLEEAIAGWRERGIPLERVALAPLGVPDVARLVDAAFPGHGVTEEAPWLVETVADITRGNAFHIVEILRELRFGPGEAIRREGDDWHVAPDLSPERLRLLVPARLDTAVRRSVEALSPQAREVLTHAAVVGEEFDVALLRAIVGDAGRVDRALEEMEARELVRAIDADLDRYRFRSAALAPSVQRALQEEDPVRARAVHRAVAEGMLAVYTGEMRLRRAIAIAHHLREAGEGLRSLPFTLAGCERLMSLQLFERARRQLAEAEPLAESADWSARERAHFHYLFGLACEATGDYEKGLDMLTRFVESEEFAPGEAPNLPRAYRRLARIHRARGEFERAQYCLGVARQLLEDLGDRRALAFVLTSLTELAVDRGRLGEARASLALAERAAVGTANEAAGIDAAVQRGRIELAEEHVGRARAAFLEAEARARALGDRGRRASSLKGLGLVALEGGYLRQARTWLEEAATLLGQLGDRPGRAAALIHLGNVFRAEGRVDRALTSYRRAQRVFSKIGHPEGVAAARHQAGRILRAWCRTTHAVRELAAAAEEYQRLGLPEAHEVLRDLGAALADAGSARPARLALIRADRRVPAGPARRAHRVFSRLVRVRLALQEEDLPRAARLAAAALRHSARTTGHAARIAAQLAAAEVALRRREPAEARSRAYTALAFAGEHADLLTAATVQRILLELAARAGRRGEIAQRAHRAARAYTGRADAYDGPALLLLALARGLERVDPDRAARYLRRARSCYARLEAQGFHAPALEDSSG